MNNGILYVNGSYIEEKEAGISPFSRGLLYGDGIFETMRAYSGKVFSLAEHYDRLMSSADFLKIGIPFDCRELGAILAELLERNRFNDRDSRIRVNLIRGQGSRSLPPDEGVDPEVIISAEEVPESIKEIQERGVKLILIESVRKDNLSILARHKTLGYLVEIIGLMEVRKKRADEGILMNYDGNISEGTTSNIFMVKDGVLMTPSLNSGILPGITRKVVLKIAGQLGIRALETDLKKDYIMSADELFITSSVREVIPVIRLGVRQYPVGTVTRQLQSEYKKYVHGAL